LKEGPPFSSQDFLMQLAEGKVDLEAIPGRHRARTNGKAAHQKTDAAD
jgi:hypothetical protein